METLSAQEFAKKYGNESVASFGVKPQESGYFDRVKTNIKGDLEKRISKYGELTAREDTGFVEKKIQQFGQGAGLAAGAIESVVGELPIAKQVIQKAGEGLQWLATSEASPIKHLGDVIGESKTLQEITTLYDTDPNFRDTVDSVGNTLRLGGDVQGLVDSAIFTKNVTNKVIRNASTATRGVQSQVASQVSTLGDSVSPNIMNRVARLDPTKAKKFEQLSGKTHGEYLVETGNFGTPDQIITKEIEKYITSKNSVDEAFAQIDGTFTDGSITDALTSLEKRAKQTSGDNVRSPYLEQVENWVQKNADTGLTMKEINEVKRLYERKVKLGYNKALNPEAVEQATNIDNALRRWQTETAKSLGFENVAELNKQTQLSKFLADELSKKLIGQSGLNNINLTDWVVLAGGDPTAVGAFITKKFFSSKAVQSKIAELLNQKEIQGIITPKTPAPQQSQ